MDFIYLSFSKTFAIIFHSISMEKQMKYVLGRWSERWVDHWSERLVVNGSKSNWQLVMTGWRAGIQKEYSQQGEKCVDGNLMNLNKSKCKVLLLEWNSPMPQDRLGAGSLECRFVEKD